jgi:glycosyltransferase involved in cell wall biosynthesis
MGADARVPWRDRQFALWQDRWFRAVEPRRLARARRLHLAHADETATPMVSFPIATYNRGEILCERTIPAILGQSHERVEVIVVGDKVVDDTMERLAAIDDPRIRFVNLPRRGRYPESAKERWFVAGSVPRNTGARLARGSWIYMISDDDVLYPDAVSKMLAFARDHDLESVTAAFHFSNGGRSAVAGGEEGLAFLGVEAGGIPAWMFRSYLRCFPWNRHSWKKSWNRPSDYDLMFRMHRCGVRMGFLDEVVARQPLVAGTDTHGSRAFIELARKGLA